MELFVHSSCDVKNIKILKYIWPCHTNHSEAKTEQQLKIGTATQVNTYHFTVLVLQVKKKKKDKQNM